MKLSQPIVKGNWHLVRFIAPAYPDENIFSGIRITPLGLVNVATCANKVTGLRVEIIDENNYCGPRDQNGLPDHCQLQAEDPAAVVGFYCGLTSTMDRVFKLSKFYHNQGAITIAGGWHAHFCPEEVLNNYFDVVVHGEGELAIGDILYAAVGGCDVTKIPGISLYLGNGKVVTNPPSRLELPDLNDIPYPDFGLIRYSKKIRTYPIGHGRGCGMNCEFCSVKGSPRWASADHTFGVVRWLAETRNAKRFFIVDDRLEEDREGILAFFRMVSEKYGDRLNFTVQIRLETAKDPELLLAMSRAGVRVVCVGFESPIREDLNAMHKGLPYRKMVEWTLELRKYFWVHGMFIFGYPSEQPSAIPVAEAVTRYKTFIREAKISSLQVLHPVPLVGTKLRERLEKQGRIFPLEVVPWSKYDGSFACFQPDNMSLAELQEKPIEIMKWFYSHWSLWRIPYRTLVFPVHYLTAGFKHWHDGWLRDIIKYGGHRTVVKWLRKNGGREYLARLESFGKFP